MGVRDVTGVFSRYFVVGYWVPCFFTLFALALVLPDSRPPAEYRALGWEGKGVVLGALAILLGLLLLGLHYPLTRMLEGYGPLESRPFRFLRKFFLHRQHGLRNQLLRVRDDETQEDAASARAARVLDRTFHQDEAKLLPTRFGNALRASENYPFTRYGLDGVAIWPRIDSLLSDRERDLHADRASDLALFVNGALGATLAGLVVAAEAAVPWWGYPIPFALSYALYRASVGAVERVGTERRASIDLHRLELYDLIGVRRPTSADDEKDVISPAVNRLLLWGEPLPEAAHAIPPQKDSSRQPR